MKYEIFPKYFLQKVLDFLNFGSYQNCTCFYESCRRNPVEIFKSWKNIEYWTTMYLWICYLAPINWHKNCEENLKRSYKIVCFLVIKRETGWNETWNIKQIIPFFEPQNQKLTETFGINNYTCTCSVQFKFFNVAMCYKMKVPC